MEETNETSSIDSSASSPAVEKVELFSFIEPYPPLEGIVGASDQNPSNLGGGSSDILVQSPKSSGAPFQYGGGEMETGKNYGGGTTSLFSQIGGSDIQSSPTEPHGGFENRITTECGGDSGSLQTNLPQER
eukprot:TRINITY_DN5262_c0_g1_i1.p2 TRINITY_DN5262_c0_g1~~TRINITY_DN5262_c0_g1_i1.p2  ORF type:complete len:154 (+),score=53.54 TRINITY_DN5262_c0_g1_i1:72-464(+)